jgi:hypothetical protein
MAGQPKKGQNLAESLALHFRDPFCSCLDDFWGRENVFVPCSNVKDIVGTRTTINDLIWVWFKGNPKYSPFVNSPSKLTALCQKLARDKPPDFFKLAEMLTRAHIAEFAKYGFRLEGPMNFNWVVFFKKENSDGFPKMVGSPQWDVMQSLFKCLHKADLDTCKQQIHLLKDESPKIHSLSFKEGFPNFEEGDYVRKFGSINSTVLDLLSGRALPKPCNEKASKILAIAIAQARKDQEDFFSLVLHVDPEITFFVSISAVAIDPRFHCDHCHKISTQKLKTCSQCLQVRYCNEDCATQAWKAHHKDQCLQLLKETSQG